MPPSRSNKSSKNVPSTPGSSDLPSTPSSSSRKRASDGALVASKRRRRAAQPSSTNVEIIDLTASPPSSGQKTSTPSKKRKTATAPSSPLAQVVGERRLKRFREKPPLTYLEKYQRATTQRMFVIDRKLTGTAEDPQMTVDIVGTTGNIYTVKIQRLPACSCPDAGKGNQCKHIIYVLINVLKAQGHLRYQLAYLASELQELFDQAPIEPSDQEKQEKVSDLSEKRRPTEGDCPICFMEFQAETEKIIWCATCGNNIHKTCFDQWAATQQSRGVRCVYCRADWPVAKLDPGDITALMRQGQINEDGYVNVASSFGLSGERDYSSYHQPWVNRRYGVYYGRYSRY